MSGAMAEDDNLIGPLVTEHQWKHLGIVLFQDEEGWIAIYKDKDANDPLNLHAGYGSTQADAVKDLLNQQYTMN